jgi:hypothetical protein
MKTRPGALLSNETKVTREVMAMDMDQLDLKGLVGGES